jgi:hypothetical protein
VIIFDLETKKTPPKKNDKYVCLIRLCGKLESICIDESITYQDQYGGISHNIKQYLIIDEP